MRGMLQSWLGVKDNRYFQGSLTQLLIMAQSLDSRLNIIEQWVRNLDAAVGRIEAAAATGEIEQVQEAVQEMRETTESIVEEINRQKKRFPTHPQPDRAQ